MKGFNPHDKSTLYDNFIKDVDPFISYRSNYWARNPQGNFLSPAESLIFIQRGFKNSISTSFLLASHRETVPEETVA